MYSRIIGDIGECMTAIVDIFNDPEPVGQVHEILIEPFNFIRATHKISPYHDNSSNEVH